MINIRSISKSTDEALKQVTFVVMVPDVEDAHGDITSEDEVRKACHNFNTLCRTPNLFHLKSTNLFDFVESYIAPTDMKIGEHEVIKGTWLAVLQVHDDALWGEITSGNISGLSIGAVASVEELED